MTMTQQETVDALARGLAPRPDALDDDRVHTIAEEAAGFYQRIRRPDPELAEPFRAGGEWKVYVEARSAIYDAALSGDVEALAPLLRDFWRNDLGPIVSQYAYYPDLAAGDEAKVERFTRMLARDYRHWRALWRDEPRELEVPRIGNPWGLELDGVLVTPLALRFDTHARQIADLLRDVDRPVVAEIGGGFGGMAERVARRDPRVTYVDFDLPETLLVAAFHLRAALPDRDVALWDPAMALDREAILRHDVVLAPHYAIADLGPASVDLFLNAFSLSEMRWEAVAEYMRAIERCGRRYFLQNNVDRTGVVNRGHERIPCSRFPLDRSVFKTLYHRFDTFQGPEGDYRESLHERIAALGLG
jgi:putative sugar O-methyltransferase